MIKPDGDLRNSVASPQVDESKVKEAADRIAACIDSIPTTAVVLGTGLHGLADEFTSPKRIAYASLPGFAQATADGHVGEFVFGKWHGQSILAMNGRFHLYEGYSVEQVTLPIRVLSQLGVVRLVLSNAAGGVNPAFSAGDVMLIAEQIDLTFRYPPSNLGESIIGRSIRKEIFSADWLESVRDQARKAGIRSQLGTYLGLTGPTYETRAEYRCMRKIGADTVGMSTVWEAKMAASLGLKVLGMSVVTNVANPDQLRTTTSEEVIAAAGRSGPTIRELLKVALVTHG